ncbi:MAG: nucleoside recognition domain-containing protein, partial [Pseudomonadota bacterium]
AAGALLWPFLRTTHLGTSTLARRCFAVPPLWIALRTLGALIALCVFLDEGPEILRGAETGVAVFRDICMPIFVIYAASAFLMGLVTDYGLMEFVGVLLQAPFSRLFRLPGRAAVDSVVSFVSSSGVGLLLTIRQYELGVYNAREASVICCSFSVVSLPFALVIAKVARIDGLFAPWYLTIVAACILAALVISRVGPLARKSEDRLVEYGAPAAAALEGENVLRRALRAARTRAGRANGVGDYLRAGLEASLDYTFGLLGPIMTVATLASVLVFRTPVFDWLAAPLAWALQLLAFPEAPLAAKGFVVGFLDQFMPAFVARGLDAEFARFVVGGLSVAQLIYLSEYGLIVLRSRLPISFLDLVVTFAVRTLIVTPVLVAGAFLVT